MTEDDQTKMIIEDRKAILDAIAGPHIAVRAGEGSDERLLFVVKRVRLPIARN